MQGKTNRRIASALRMTEKTASVHVSHILAKLSVSSRGEAVARAYEVGLEGAPISTVTELLRRRRSSSSASP